MALDTKRLNDLTTEISKELQRYVVIAALKKLTRIAWVFMIMWRFSLGYVVLHIAFLKVLVYE